MALKKTSLSLLLFSLMLNITSIQAQKIKEQDVLLEQIELPDKSIQVLATNKKNYPQVVNVSFVSLKNMESTAPLPLKKILKANEEKVLMTTLIPDINKAYGMGFEYNSYPGDKLNPVIDKDFIYNLPYEAGKSYNIGQGYAGEYSHNMKNRHYALDFDMPEGSKVCAARSGTVFIVKQDSDRHGKTINSSKYANFITIAHGDGSFANYFHLKQNGSLVKEGDIVKVGDVIGLSGNTGWSVGPHLHLEIYYFNEDGDMISMPTKFNLPNDKPGLLKEHKSYTR